MLILNLFEKYKTKYPSYDKFELILFQKKNIYIIIGFINSENIEQKLKLHFFEKLYISTYKIFQIK